MIQFITCYKYLLTLILCCNCIPLFAQTSGVVSENGILQVNGNTIQNKNGEPFDMAGNSLFWSGFGVGMPFYNSEVVDFLVEDWQSNFIRIPMAVEEADGAFPQPTDPNFDPSNLVPNPNAQGYFNNPQREYDRIRPVIQAAIDNDIYVIVDFHSHFADEFQEEAITFFTDIATEFGDSDHIIYEIFNEPIGLARNRSGDNDSMAFQQFDETWETIIRPYAIAVINAIRAIDPDNMIIVGTPGFSQGIETAAANPITLDDLNLPAEITNPNLAYTLHFYAGQPEHAALRTSLENALDNPDTGGIPIVVTEWGTVAASGNGAANVAETQAWMELLKERNVSHANWSVSDANETSAVIQAGQGINGLFNDALTGSGNLVRCIIERWDTNNFQNCDLNGNSVEIDPSLLTKVEVETPQGEIDPNSGATSEFRSAGLSEEIRADGEGILTGFVQGEACVFRLNDITTSGFTIIVELSSNTDGYTLELRRDAGITFLASQPVPNTGGLDNYQILRFSDIPFTGPNQEIALGVSGNPGGSVNIESFRYLNESENPCPTITRYTTAGGWDNGIPDGSLSAIINDNYDTAIQGDIITCNLTISSDFTLTVGDNTFVNVTNDIVVNGALTIANQGSIVQAGEAQTINNGTIQVQKTTPLLNPREFIVLGSPMSGETTSGVYGDADRAFEIIPELFTPHPDVTSAINFTDANFDYFAPASDITPGQGYLIFPQNTNASDAITYDHTYTQGTLNSGTINLPLTYNGPATENNFNVASNPYPSSIDNNLLISNNPQISELYFWEHLTDPSTDNPGPNTSNFSMDDISVYNLIGGVAAINGGTAPGQFMVSGQGFAILANEDFSTSETPLTFTNAMRVTGNNTTVRIIETNTERLRLSLTHNNFKLQSSTLIGFSELATIGYDTGFDSNRLDNTISLFSTLDNGKQLAIQGRETFDSTMEISLGFETHIVTPENYTISLADFEGTTLEKHDIILIDNTLGVITNLKKDNYTFTTTQGIQSNRFTVAFEGDILNVEDISLENSLRLFPNPTSRNVSISFSSNQQVNTISLMNINGVVIRNYDLTTTQNAQKLDISNISSGIYLVRVEGVNAIVTKKLVIR